MSTLVEVPTAITSAGLVVGFLGETLTSHAVGAETIGFTWNGTSKSLGYRIYGTNDIGLCAVTGLTGVAAAVLYCTTGQPPRATDSRGPVALTSLQLSVNGSAANSIAAINASGQFAGQRETRVTGSSGHVLICPRGFVVTTPGAIQDLGRCLTRARAARRRSTPRRSSRVGPRFQSGFITRFAGRPAPSSISARSAALRAKARLSTTQARSSGLRRRRTKSSTQPSGRRQAPRRAISEPSAEPRAAR